MAEFLLEMMGAEKESLMNVQSLIRGMKEVCWPYFDPEFDNLPERIFGPVCRVIIDNESMADCSVIKINGVNKQDILLGLVQVLTDLNLRIVKGYVSSDAGWFMDVFHVKDEHGKKITDESVINHIQQGITTNSNSNSNINNSNNNNNNINNNNTAMPASSPLNWRRTATRPKSHPLATAEHTAIEITAADRPGLFSEITAALADLSCNVVEAHAWIHNDRLACVAHISDESSANPSSWDPHRLAGIQDHLSTVLRGTTTLPDAASAHQEAVKATDVVGGGEGGMISDVERRLHQLMHSVRDFEEAPRMTLARSSGASSSSSSSFRPPFEERSSHEVAYRKAVVSVESCPEKGYSIVTLECNDRQRLMFDTVCTLNDMQYVIFHASISSRDGYAFQEYFIRHVDGCPLNTQSEKDRVTKCLEAAIERRVCEGVRLELRAANRLGLLSDITRVLRENGLAVVRADVATEGEKAINAFYIRDLSGKDVDMEFVESVRREMDGPISVQVRKEMPLGPVDSPERCRLSLGEMLRSHIGRISHSLMH